MRRAYLDIILDFRDAWEARRHEDASDFLAEMSAAIDRLAYPHPDKMKPSVEESVVRQSVRVHATMKLWHRGDMTKNIARHEIEKLFVLANGLLEPGIVGDDRRRRA